MGIAIKAEHLSKEYRLGIINHGVLFRDVQSWIARKTGKIDPHSKIGAEHFADSQDRFWALKNLDFEIEQGDRVGIIGRNGAGKSTLLKILSRVTEPTEGLVIIKGRIASLLEVGTGFHPELTGRDNIYLAGAIQGMKKREIARKIEEIIDFSEIEKFIDTPVKRYSSGMYVRLGFAVAAHLDSEILLADEVLAVGDQTFQKKCLGKMEDVSRKEGRTVLFVSHNMGSVSGLCTKGMLLEQGALIKQGIINEVLATYSSDKVSSFAHFDDGFIKEAIVEQVEQRIRVTVKYKEIAKIDVPSLGIKLYDANGSIIYVVNPYNHELRHDVSPGFPGNTIIVDIWQPLLNNGIYFLSLVFADSNRSYETKDKCLRLEVFNMVDTKFAVNTQLHGAVFPVCEYWYS